MKSHTIQTKNRAGRKKRQENEKGRQSDRERVKIEATVYLAGVQQD